MSERHHDDKHKCKIHIHHHHHHCPMHCPMMPMPMPMPMPAEPEMILPETIERPICPPPIPRPMPLPTPMPGPDIIIGPITLPMPMPEVFETPQQVPPCRGQIYTVVRGDTLSAIARRFGTTVAEILRVNPQITNPDLIFEGQRICIPVVGPSPACPGGTLYTVIAGDTLTAIAVRFGVTLNQLLAANPQITNPDVIFAGQQICIPSVFPPPGVCPGGQVYVIVSGDTLTSIAARFGVTVAAILAANPQITNPDVIFAGQRICIPPRG